MATQRSGSLRRVRRVVPLCVALLVVAITATGCGTTGDEPTSVAAGDADTAGSTSGSATTVAETAGRPSACGAVTKVFLTPASDDFAQEHLGRDPEVGQDEGDRLIKDLIADHPDELDAAFTKLARLMEKSETGAEASDQDVIDLDAAVGAVTVWGVKHCDPSEPVWKCFSHRSFSAVGSAIDADGESTNVNGKATPEAALAALDDGAGSTELARADDAVLFGWLDAEGLVVRTVEIDRNPDETWSMKVDTSCSDDKAADDSDDGFTPIGESIPE